MREVLELVAHVDYRVGPVIEAAVNEPLAVGMAIGSASEMGLWNGTEDGQTVS